MGACSSQKVCYTCEWIKAVHGRASLWFSRQKWSHYTRKLGICAPGRSHGEGAWRRMFTFASMLEKSLYMRVGAVHRKGSLWMSEGRKGAGKCEAWGLAAGVRSYSGVSQQELGCRVCENDLLEFSDRNKGDRLYTASPSTSIHAEIWRRMAVYTSSLRTGRRCTPNSCF